MIDDKIYDTVILVDIIEINNDTYFIVSVFLKFFVLKKNRNIY